MFNEKDVITVAEALLEDPVEFADGDFNSYFWCLYCDDEMMEFDTVKKVYRTKNNFKHNTDCPCLIAQDILTRLK